MRSPAPLWSSFALAPACAHRPSPGPCPGRGPGHCPGRSGHARPRGRGCAAAPGLGGNPIPGRGPVRHTLANPPGRPGGRSCRHAADPGPCRGRHPSAARCRDGGYPGPPPASCSRSSLNFLLLFHFYCMVSKAKAISHRAERVCSHIRANTCLQPTLNGSITELLKIILLKVLFCWEPTLDISPECLLA